MNQDASRGFWARGEPYVWCSGTALAMTLILMVMLLWIVLVNGLGVFWPTAVAQIQLKDGKTVVGEYRQDSLNPDTNELSHQFKTGNRDIDPSREDFHWYFEKNIVGEMTYPEDVVVLERVEDGNFYGFIKEVKTPTLTGVTGNTPIEQLADALNRSEDAWAEAVLELREETFVLAERLQDIKLRILKINYCIKQLRASPGTADEIRELEQERALYLDEVKHIKKESDELVRQQEEAEEHLKKNVAVFATASGQDVTIPLIHVVRQYQPNRMGVAAKVWHYLAKIVELLTDEPRESNTEGGLFPAIFGTVMLIFLMAFTSFPLGVLAGIYLREYAKEGILVRMVRIAVNNLAGIPSIVYGIFGLGFFVYRVGGSLDAWLYPERVEAGITTFGTGGILWASMTLGLLTVPVVIVSVEEALGAIPMGVRQGSLALGATKFQTLVRVLLPMASPGILTGFILAMARAAGEVAPLMITGVVKLAPTLPLDLQFPFGFDRKFMHLGFHIYDIGFQSPNVEAAMPMVYVTTFLLLAIVLAMTSLAIVMRNRMRKRYEIRSI